MIRANMADGTVLRFPDGTPQAVIDQRAKEHVRARQRENRETATVMAVAQPEPEPMARPSGALAAEPAPIPQPFRGPDLGPRRPPMGLSRTPEGQLQLTAPDVALPSLSTGAGDPGSAVAKGTRDLFTGLVTAPLDIAGANETAEFVRRNIPEVNVPGAAQEFGAAALQFGVPAATAAGAARTALTNAPRLVAFLGEAGAAGLADALAAVPGQVSTIGNMLGGPTAIEAGDSPLTQRMKLGVEAGAVGAAAETLIRPLMVTGNFLYRLIRPIVATDTEAQALAETALREAAMDPEKAIQNLESALAESAGSEFRPTSGTASGDPGLIAGERGQATRAGSSAAFAQRKAENLAALSEEVAGVTRQPTGATPAATQAFAETQASQALREQAEGVARLERLNREAADEVDNLIGELQPLRGREGEAAATASEGIDQAFRQELTARTIRKNELFDAIDPDRTVELDDFSNLQEGLSEAITKRGPLDSSAVKVRAVPVVKNLRKRVKQATREETPVPLSFGDLQDLRPELSAEIAKARKAGEGGVVPRLVALKEAVEAETAILAERGPREAAVAAQRAIDYFRDEFAPLFRRGTGRDLAMAIRQDRPVPASAVARQFIKPKTAPGSREAARDLDRLATASAPRAETEAVVRDYVLAQLSEVAIGPTGRLMPQNVRKFRENFQEALSRFPAIQREVSDLVARAARTTERQSVMERQLKLARQSMQQSERAQNRSVAGLFLDKSPVDAIRSALDSSNPVQAMRGLVELVDKDPSGMARKGLKRALGDYIEQQVRANTVTPGGEDFQLVLNRMNSLTKDPKVRQAMRALYSSREMSALNQVQKRMQMMDRINQQVTAGSPTANLSRQANRARIILASLYGIVKGRGIFAISDFVAKSLGRDPAARAEALIQQAYLDPELAIILLSRPSDDSVGKLRTYLTNNILAEAGPEPEAQ